MNFLNSAYSETMILIAATAISLIGSLFIIRLDWIRYGLLFLLTAITGNILCYIFVRIGSYSFPVRLFPHISIMPFEAILTVFPFYVLLGVRYSPSAWAYKIPFYWAFVHLGMLGETIFLNTTRLIKYNSHLNMQT